MHSFWSLVKSCRVLSHIGYTVDHFLPVPMKPWWLFPGFQGRSMFIKRNERLTLFTAEFSGIVILARVVYK